MLDRRAAGARSLTPRPKPYMAQPLRRKAELEAALDGIVRSYEAPLEINNLESAALPNKRAVIEAYNHLVCAIYMGFYSRRGLSIANLRDSVSEHVHPAYTGFVEQTALRPPRTRRFGYPCPSQPLPLSACRAWSLENQS